MNKETASGPGRYLRIAIVTGATSGIGQATARRLVVSGYGVVGNARDAIKLRELELEFGEAFYGVAGDAAEDEIQELLFESAREHFGRPADIVVANAGKGLGGSVKDADLSHVDSMIRLNVTGTLLLLQKAAREMLEARGEGLSQHAADIVIIGSVVGRNVSPFSAVYSATKFAVHALAEGLRREMGPKGIRVSLVEPGIVVSGFQRAAGYSEELVHDFEERFGPLLQGEDIASAVHYILSQPPHVHVSEIMVRPTRQDYP